MRSLLFAGAMRPDHVARLPRSAPDAVVIDLEDAVSAQHKGAARSAAAELTADLRASNPELDIYVRVNAVATSWFAADMAVALSPSATGVVVPKVEDVADLDAVQGALARAELPGLRVIVGIESARGIACVERVLAGGIHAAYFGAEDLISDIGGRRTPEGTEVLYARSRFVLAARLGGVIPVDQVVVDVRDADAFRTDALRGRALGFSGKLCVHPSQVGVANEVFGVTEEERDRAARLLEAWTAAAATGVGAIEFEGRMVDEPAVRAARETLRRAAAPTHEQQ